ncbi:site-specific integrase [Bradyrhizobium sp. JYMT SZCCT0428]|uniref:tyrosine-type recombinase/integrase n=1 Tax=Bradyrhizobium sp. JYMT SZCCT0428 TaxID=2807673 RepID=UPI001BA6536D|nr:site-specific integrase [Bradyrhizobium sp. JYMT SZCCT0428]MBR1157196.1 tyrosine-type recombinase/integrase [Bradyrhizobium sp. JYMT SZCCT0428]
MANRNLKRQPAQRLTAVAIAAIKPGRQRREIPDADSGGLKLIVQPSGAKSWAVKFRRPNGKLVKLTLGPLDQSGREAPTEPQVGDPLTLKAARVLALTLVRQRARNVDVFAEHHIARRRQRSAVVEASAHTYPHAARAFIDDHRVDRTGQKPRRWLEVAKLLGLAYPPAGGEPIHVKHGLCDRWREKPIASINGDDIYTVIEEARRSGVPGLVRRNTGTSDPRGRRMADALGTMFNWLKKHRRITADPCFGIHRPPPPAARDRVLNVKTDIRGADELRWFWTASDAVGPPFGALCKLLLLTGCRLNEIARMTRDELSDDFATLRLPGTRTKNGLPHNVPLPPLGREIIANLSQLAGCNYVFSTNGKTPVSGFSKYKARFDAAMWAAAKMERGRTATVTPWRLHDLRRSCATGMAGIGIPPHIIEAALNHVSGAKGGVAGTYNREQYEPEKRAALERWADHIASIVAGRAGNVVPLRGRS